MTKHKREKTKADKPKAEPAFSNNPFAAAKATLKRALEKPAAPPAPAPPPPPAEPTPAAPTFTSADEEQLFLQEMSLVRQIPVDPRGRVGVVPKPRPPTNWRQRDDAEAYAQLADLVEGIGPFEISDTEEYVEGLAPGIDRRLLRKLRRGDYAVQAHLDLHGFVAEEAQAEVEQFLLKARTEDRRCVLLVHGRGYHSKDGIPVLKEKLKVWLTRGRLSHHVLAFCTARPSDGGAGAMYVLLRR